MQYRKIEKTIIALAFILIPFLFFKNGFQHGKILFGPDTISLDFPFRLFAQRMFQQYHDLPLWMPYLFGGIPLIDSTNLIYFYPTNLLYMLLPIPLYYTYTMDIIIHMLVAAFGMYLLLRRFETTKEASLFGGFVFMISGFLISLVNVGHWGNIKAMALIPYVFYFISRGIKEKKIFHFLNASLFAALMILCIGMQLLLYTYFGVILYIVYELFFTEHSRDMKAIKKTAIFFILSLVMIVLFSALQLFQTTGYIEYSWRGDFTYFDFTQWSFNPLESISFLFPNFFGLQGDTYYGFEAPNYTTLYIGIIPFLLLPFAFMLKKSRRQAIFFSAAAAVFFILGCGWYIPFYRILFYVPVINKFRTPLRYIYFFDMFIIMLSAIAISNILAITREKKYKINFKGNTLFKIWSWTAAAAGIIFFIMLVFISNPVHVSDFINNTFFYVWKKNPSLKLYHPQYHKSGWMSHILV